MLVAEGRYAGPPHFNLAVGSAVGLLDGLPLEVFGVRTAGSIVGSLSVDAIEGLLVVGD